MKMTDGPDPEPRSPSRLPGDWKVWLPGPWTIAAWGLVLALLLWLFWGPLTAMIRIWWMQPDYGHGFFVIPFALLLLWVRRDLATPLPRKGSWWGLAFFALFGMLWFASIYFRYGVAGRLAIIPCMAGIALFVGGWRALHWAWPSIAFLVFMVPLPGFLQNLLRQPLQHVGTVVSVGIIQTLGIPAANRGNVIVLPNGELGVVEACSGLRMLMLFFAVCIGAAFLLKRPWWEKAIMVVSAVPIALAANIIRITVTAVLHEMVNTELADVVFHDLAGLMMMPIGILMLWAELWLLEQLIIDSAEERKPLTSLLGDPATLSGAKSGR